jgi:hypothetical protein
MKMEIPANIRTLRIPRPAFLQAVLQTNFKQLTNNKSNSSMQGRCHPSRDAQKTFRPIGRSGECGGESEGVAAKNACGTRVSRSQFPGARTFPTNG